MDFSSVNAYITNVNENPKVFVLSVPMDSFTLLLAINDPAIAN